jgi:hypothetical protein
VCLYDVAEKVMLRRFQVSSNRSLDGVMDQLNSKKLTDAGPLDLIQDVDSDAEDILHPIQGRAINFSPPHDLPTTPPPEAVIPLNQHIRLGLGSPRYKSRIKCEPAGSVFDRSHTVPRLQELQIDYASLQRVQRESKGAWDSKTLHC